MLSELMVENSSFLIFGAVAFIIEVLFDFGLDLPRLLLRIDVFGDFDRDLSRDETVGCQYVLLTSSIH